MRFLPDGGGELILVIGFETDRPTGLWPNLDQGIRPTIAWSSLLFEGSDLTS